MTYIPFEQKVFRGQGLWKRYGVTGENVATCPGLAEMAIDDMRSSTDVAWQTFTGYAYNGSIASMNFNNRKLMRGSAETVAFSDSIVFNSFNKWSPVGSSITPWNGSTNTLNTPSFQGRHSGRCGVLWLDGHATLEQVIYAPASATFAGFVDAHQKFRDRKLGYIVRSPEALNSIAANYYFTPSMH